MNSSSSGASDRNGSTTTNSVISNNINNDPTQTEEATSNTDNNPYADDFKNIINVNDEQSHKQLWKQDKMTKSSFLVNP